MVLRLTKISENSPGCLAVARQGSCMRLNKKWVKDLTRWILHEGAWVAVTPHGVLPRGSDEISPTVGGWGTQVDDFTKGCSKESFTKHVRRRNGGGQGDPDLLMICQSA